MSAFLTQGILPVITHHREFGGCTILRQDLGGVKQFLEWLGANCTAATAPTLVVTATFGQAVAFMSRIADLEGYGIRKVGQHGSKIMIVRVRPDGRSHWVPDVIVRYWHTSADELRGLDFGNLFFWGIENRAEILVHAARLARMFPHQNHQPIEPTPTTGKQALFPLNVTNQNL